jgi:hypothetical protein
MAFPQGTCVDGEASRERMAPIQVISNWLQLLKRQP